jgi:hypothetical protein
MQAALEAPILYPIYFLEIEFNAGTVRVWTGLGDRDWDGHTWSGVGWLVGFTEVTETAEIRATNLTISLRGVDLAIVALVLLNLQQNKPAKVWQGLLSPGPLFDDAPDKGVLIDDPLLYYEGRVDFGEIDKDPENPAIRISCESRLRDLERARVRRYTHEDQQIDYPGDLGFQYAHQVDKPFRWGGG